MKYTKLGADGPEVSRISLGCMSFGGFYGPTHQAESFACLDAAKTSGINFLDTAEIYGLGKSERTIGAYQKETGHRFHIATKGGIKIGGARGENDNSHDGLRKALEGSLSRLGVDHVALYYVHRRDWSVPIEAVVETLVSFKNEGLIGGFGFSEIAPSSLRRAHAVHPVAAIQNEYSLWTRYPDLGLIQTCRELGVTFVPFSPLARGMLTDVCPDPDSFSETDFRSGTPRFTGDNFVANKSRIDEFREFCQSKGWTTASTAIAWALDQGDHLIPIPGTRTAGHLLEWSNACELELSESDRSEIAHLLPVGFAHGDRYSDAQIVGVERYC